MHDGVFSVFGSRRSFMHNTYYALVKNIQSSSIFWLICCHNLNKFVCDFVVCGLSVCVCADEMLVPMMVFSVTATRSLAVCQPSKACYVIKDFCALYPVSVCAWLHVLEGLYMAQLITSGCMEADTCFTLRAAFTVCAVQIWRCTTLHPCMNGFPDLISSPISLFVLTRGRPGPSTPRGAGFDTRARLFSCFVCGG